MGSLNSKAIQTNNYSSISHLTRSNCFSSFSRRQSLLSSYNLKNDSTNFRNFYYQRRVCAKKKVLILGLDGVGKTDLFTRLICHDKQELTIDSLPQPTIGYNVETIKIRNHHLCTGQHHKITLWDCGGHSSVQPLWPYYYSNTSLLLWVINIHDRSRLDANLHLLSRILTNSLLYRIPVLIVLYNSSSNQSDDDDTDEKLLTNLEVAFRFLATISTSRASTFKWQVINVTLNDNDSQTDLKKIRQCFRELMEL